MEGDFAGFNWKEALLPVVKEEIPEGNKDPVFMEGAGMQWPFSNKVSALTQFMPAETAQKKKHYKRIMFDSVAPSTFQPFTTANIFDSNDKGSEISQGYPFSSFCASHASHEIQSLPVSYQLAPGGSNMMTTSPLKQTFIGNGGISVTSPRHIVPFTGSIAGTYASRSPSKTLAAPSQMTIFYAGMVNVYDNISPEKAQETMLLAGNGSSLIANVVTHKATVHASALKCTASDGIHGKLPQTSSPCSRLSSPVSATSNAISQSRIISSKKDDLMVMKTIGSLTHRSQPEPPKIITSIGSRVQQVSTKAVSPIGSEAGTRTPTVPQSRKASLARFLEKRKERSINATPYHCEKSIQEGTGSEHGFERNAASIALPSNKDKS